MPERKFGLREVIIGSLSVRGEACPTEIVADIEKATGLTVDPVLVRQALRRMIERHILVQPGYGVYALHARYLARSQSVQQHTETFIRDVLRAAGGIARTKDIHAAIWDRPNGGIDRPYDHRRVTTCLSSSIIFRQDYGRGIWNLGPEELERLPLLGRWAAYNVERDTEHADQEDMFAERDAFFEKVGSAFTEAQDNCDLDDIVTIPAIRDPLAQMVSDAPSAWSMARGYVAAEIEATPEARDNPYHVGVMLRQREPDIYAELLAMFELGDPNLHLVAPVEFYRACANIFGVCAAALSRGRVVRADIGGETTAFTPTD